MRFCHQPSSGRSEDAGRSTGGTISRNIRNEEGRGKRETMGRRKGRSNSHDTQNRSCQAQPYLSVSHRSINSKGDIQPDRDWHLYHPIRMLYGRYSIRISTLPMPNRRGALRATIYKQSTEGRVRTRNEGGRAGGKDQDEEEGIAA
jgi:hypothetical protein